MGSFLLEYYPPFLQLISSEGNKKKLMNFGLNKSSKLVKISLKDARENKDDLILFRNTFPNVIKTVEVKLKNKVQQEDRGVWIGWKKGNEFEVIKPKEAGGHGEEALYGADFAYKVTIDPVYKMKRETKKAWKELDQEQNKQTKSSAADFGYKKYWSLFNSRLQKVLDTWTKAVIKQYENQFEGPFLKSTREESSYNTGFSTLDYDLRELLNLVQNSKDSLNDDREDNKEFNSKKYMELLQRIDSQLKTYIEEQGI